MDDFSTTHQPLHALTTIPADPVDRRVVERVVRHLQVAGLRPLSVVKEEAAVMSGGGRALVRDHALQLIGGSEEGERSGEGERRVELEARLVVRIVVESLQVEEYVRRKRVEDLLLHHRAKRVAGVAEEVWGRNLPRAYCRLPPPSSALPTTPRSSSSASPPATDTARAPCGRKSVRIADSEAPRASCTRTVAKSDSGLPARSESSPVCPRRN